LKVGINDLPSVAKKKVTVAAVSVSSMEAFPTVGLALQLEMPMVAAASIHGRKVGGGVLKLWPGWPAVGGGGQYPPKDGGCQYPPGGGGGHIGGCPTVGDPPHGITVGGPV
jgi:hypothetical protein